MEITIRIPDQVAADLRIQNGDLPRKLLEAYALEGYRSEGLTAHQVKVLLDFDTDMEVDGFLKAHGVPLELTRAELDRQRAALSEKKPPFQSVQGMLPGEFEDLEAEIANMRSEAWRNFPRDIPPEENP